VLNALGDLGLPIIADVECDHVAPYLPIVNGTLGHVQFGAGLASLTSGSAKNGDLHRQPADTSVLTMPLEGRFQE